MKNRQIPRRLSSFLANQDGAIAIVIALMLPVLLGFAGLAVDMGHSYAVKSQLKNAADAGALRGARALVPYTGSPETPNWALALSKAPEAVKLNRADNKQLTDSVVTYGYWSFTTSPPSLQSAGISPTANDFPAVRVTVSKTAGSNGGPISMYLASFLGVLPADVGATSVAIISFPTAMPPGGLKPMVATTDIIDKYWGMSDPDNPGQPFQFKLGDGKQAEDTMWSTFKVDRQFQRLHEGIDFNRQPHRHIYRRECHGSNRGLGRSITGRMKWENLSIRRWCCRWLLPETLTEKTFAPILDFIAFHITGYSQGGQYVEGYFDKNYVVTNPQKGSGVPSNPYSTPSAPQLVN